MFHSHILYGSTSSVYVAIIHREKEAQYFNDQVSHVHC